MRTVKSDTGSEQDCAKTRNKWIKKSPSFRLYNPTNFTKQAPKLIWQINQIRPVHPKSPASSHLLSSCAQRFFCSRAYTWPTEAYHSKSTYLISESNKNLILTPIPLLQESIKSSSLWANQRLSSHGLHPSREEVCCNYKMITFQTWSPHNFKNFFRQHLKQARSQEGEGKTARQTWMAAGAERSNT